MNQDDLQLMLAEVKRFGGKSVAHCLPSPEHRLSAANRQALVASAVQAGILDAGADGLGIWGHAHTTPYFSACALHSIASINAGFAWVLHQHALLRVVMHALNVTDDPATMSLSYLGNYGLGGEEMLRLLRGKHVVSGGNAVGDAAIEGYFDTHIMQRLIMGEDWRSCIAIGWHPENGLGWFCHHREQVEARRLDACHGLNEVPFKRVKFLSSGRWLSSDSERSDNAWSSNAGPNNGLLLNLLFYDGVANVAIMLGILQQATEKSIEYSGLRCQGGKMICQHSAVKALLAELKQALQAGTLFLNHVSSIENAMSGFIETCRWRSHWMPVASKALNAAMQIHGGCGYMQDVGIEKCVRDGNMLRVMHGSPLELGLLSELADQLQGGA